MSGSPATVWQGPAGTVPVVNGNGNIFEEVQVAAGGQTVFNLLTFQYTPGTHSIFVYRKTAGMIGAELLRRGGVDYTETSNSAITLAAGAVAGDLLAFVAIAINQLLTPPIANGMPSGGTAGQVLAKVSGSDYAVNWVSLAALGTLLDAPRVNVASASTVDLTPQATVTRNIQITGNTQIDGFQIANGQVFAVKFQASLLLKNNAAIITQSGADISVNSGDTCLVRATADNVVEILAFVPAYKVLKSFRNKLINGNPLINQRAVAGAVVLAAGAYGHDRWKAGAAGCSYTFNTVNNVTTITITAGSLMQVIEGVNLQSGIHTLAWVGTSQGRVDAGAYGASPVNGTAVGGTNQTIEFNVGSFSLAQYEPGAVPSPFEHRFNGIELALCQRYAWTPGATYQFNAAHYSGAGLTAYHSISFPVPMRIAPTFTITWSALSNAAANASRVVGNTGAESSINIVAAPGIFSGVVAYSSFIAEL